MTYACQEGVEYIDPDQVETNLLQYLKGKLDINHDEIELGSVFVEIPQSICIYVPMSAGHQVVIKASKPNSQSSLVEKTEFEHLITEFKGLKNTIENL